MDDLFNNSYGITSEQAKVRNSRIDQKHDISPSLRFEEKKLVYLQISDPIDREEELMLDETEYRAAQAHEIIDAMPWPCNKPNLHRKAYEFEEDLYSSVIIQSYTMFYSGICKSLAIRNANLRFFEKVTL